MKHLIGSSRGWLGNDVTCAVFFRLGLEWSDLVCTADHRELACRYLGKRGPDDLNIEESQAGFAIHTRLTIRGVPLGNNQ